MTDSFNDLPPTAALELQASTVPDPLASRENAVNRIFTGVALTLLASPTLFLGGFFFETALEILGVLAVLGSVALAGAGLTSIGLAARHLRRFGGALGAMFLAAFGGFGSSVLVWLVSMALRRFASEGPMVGMLSRLAGLGMTFFVVLFSVVVVVGLTRWAAETAARER